MELIFIVMCCLTSCGLRWQSRAGFRERFDHPFQSVWPEWKFHNMQFRYFCHRAEQARGRGFGLSGGSVRLGFKQ
jgi:hypothetical protein